MRLSPTSSYYAQRTSVGAGSADDTIVTQGVLKTLSDAECIAAARHLIVYAGPFARQLTVMSREGLRLPPNLWSSASVRAAVRSVVVRTDPNGEHARLPRWMGHLPRLKVLVDHGQIEERRARVLRSKTVLLNREEPLPDCLVFVTSARTPLLPVPLRHLARVVLVVLQDHGFLLSRGWAAHLRPFFLRHVEVTFLFPPDGHDSFAGCALAAHQLVRGIGDIVRDIPASSRSHIYIVNADHAFVPPLGSKSSASTRLQQAVDRCDAVVAGTLDLAVLRSRVSLLKLDEYRSFVGEPQYALEIEACTPFHAAQEALRNPTIGPIKLSPDRETGRKGIT